MTQRSGGVAARQVGGFHRMLCTAVGTTILVIAREFAAHFGYDGVILSSESHPRK